MTKTLTQKEYTMLMAGLVLLRERHPSLEADTVELQMALPYDGEVRMPMWRPTPKPKPARKAPRLRVPDYLMQVEVARETIEAYMEAQVESRRLAEAGW